MSDDILNYISKNIAEITKNIAPIMPDKDSPEIRMSALSMLLEYYQKKEKETQEKIDELKAMINKEKENMTLVEAFQIVKDRYGDVTLEHAFHTDEDWFLTCSTKYQTQIVVKVLMNTENGIVIERVA